MKKMEDQQDDTKKPCIQPPLDYPWLLFRANKGNTGYIYSPTSPPYKGFCSTSFIPDDLWIHKVYNCCYGWLILSANQENELFLWNPVLSRLIKLPPHQVRGDYKYFKGAVLLSPGNRTDDLDPNCMIIIFVHEADEKQKPFSIMHCLLGQQCRNSVCYGDEIANFYYPNPIVMNDLVYVEGEVKGGKKLFCINRIDKTGIVLTEYCKLPPYTLHNSKEGYLIASFGELFYLIVTEDWPDDSMSFVEVFKLDQVSMNWKKVRDVGDRVFFIDGNVAYSISSRANSENQGGSLYHCFYRNDWYSYHFVDNSLSNFPLQSTWKLPNGFDQIILYLPDRRLIDEQNFQMNLVETGQYEVVAGKIKEETKNCKIYEDDKAEKDFLLFCMTLFRLPDDLIGFIFRKFINPVDYLNFRSVSKICRLLAPKIEWRRTPSNLAYAPAPISPWLVSFNSHSSTYHLVDSEFGGKYLIKTPKSLIYTKIISSNNGWLLLLSKSTKKTLSLYNPLTSKIIKLPKLHSSLHGRDLKISFSSSPTSSNCVVVGIADRPSKTAIEIFSLRIGNTRWNTGIFPLYDSHIWTSECRVSHAGDVYVVDNNRNLAIFDFQVDEILPVKIIWTTKVPDSYLKHILTVECDGKLLAASISEGGESVNVFAWICKTASWEEIDSLGDYTLYLSKTSCFSTTARFDWMKNKIFFPRFHDDNIVYYSMETRKYYSLADKNHALLEVEHRDTRELLMSWWFQPSWL